MSSNCKAKDPHNCRFHGTGKYDAARPETMSKEDRIAYLTTPEGVQELRAKGKHELADKYEARCQRLEAQKRWEEAKNRKPLRLALDLDETSGGFVDALRRHVAEERGMTAEEAAAAFPAPQYYSFVQSGWFKDTEEFLDAFHAAEKNGIYRKMEAFKGVSKTLRTLVADRHIEVHVVTARESAWNEDTRHWIRKNRIPVRTITHTEAKETVDGIDVYIDDSDKQLTTLQSHGKTVIAFDNPTNRHVETPHRVKGWSEVPSVLRVIADSRS